ncbi:MAG: DUF1579 domain-containing protein [Ignavibacteria bacterium]
MKITIKTFLTIIIFSITTQIFAQTDAEMKAWMAYMTPGSVHDMLAKSNGEWSSEISLWMSPDAPPTKSTGTVVNSMILGGRYQQSTNLGNFMGMPFEGISIVGYDNSKKKFVSSWVDNMGTGMVYMEGTWDDATRTVNLSGKQTDPMTGLDMVVRETFEIIDDNNQKLEMFMTQNGKEMKTMEIIFKRK